MNFKNQIPKKLSSEQNRIFVELYFNLNLHLNLNIKSDFQVNSQFSTFLHETCVDVKEFFSSSCHITMVLIAIHDLYHDLKYKPKK